MIAKVYIYLRDGQAKNWTSLKIQRAEINSLRTQVMSVGAGDGANTGYSCSHCKSGLHGGGRGSCPWKDKLPADAKTGAAAFMLRISEGAAAQH